MACYIDSSEEGMCGAFYYSRTNGRIFTLKMRHPERSEGSPEAGMVFNSEMLRAKDDVPRVMTN